MPRSNWLMYSTAMVSVATLAGAGEAGAQTLGFADVTTGEYDGVNFNYVGGSFLAPLPNGVELQFDGMIGEVDSEFAYGVGAHLFTDVTDELRTGLYADTAHTDAAGGFSQNRLGVEGQYRTDKTQFGAIVGHQDGDLADGLFGSLSASFFPTDNLSLSLTHSFQPDPISQVTSVEAEHRFAAGHNAIAVFGGAGYVHDHDDWSVSAGLRIYFGGARNRDFVTQGVPSSRPAPMPQHFGLFFQAASEAQNAIEDGMVE